MNFSDNKAGLAGLDKERIERIITENTSANFDSHAQKKRRRIDERIARNKQALETISDEKIRQTEAEIQPLVDAIETNRRVDRIRVHIDMDAYFAAVEMRDDPRLRSIPMAVGSDAMLSTSNYIARQFGVRSAMPGFIARKLCPQLTIVRGNYGKYSRESRVVQAVFERFDPKVSMASLDEAYMDITDYVANRTEPVVCQRIRYSGDCECRLPLVKADEFEAENRATEVERRTETCAKCGKERIVLVDSTEFGTGAEEVVRQIRFEVEQTTGLTCSAGIAANGMLAKICSDMRKPNGQFSLPRERDAIVAFIRDLPIRKVSGIGAVSEAVLKGLGILKCGDLFTRRATVRLLFSDCSFHWFLRVSLGVSGDSSGGQLSESSRQESLQKSTSIERTFAPSNDPSKLLQTTRTLCVKLIESLPRDGIEGGRSATLKVKFASFDVITRCQSVNFLIQSAETLYPIIEKLLRRELKNGVAVRLLGVRLSHLEFTDDHSTATDGEPRQKRSGGEQTSMMNFMRKRRVRGGKSAADAGTSSPVDVIELDSSTSSESEGDADNDDEATTQAPREADLLDVSMDEASVHYAEAPGPSTSFAAATGMPTTNALDECPDLTASSNNLSTQKDDSMIVLDDDDGDSDDRGGDNKTPKRVESVAKKVVPKRLATSTKSTKKTHQSKTPPPKKTELRGVRKLEHYFPVLLE